MGTGARWSRSGDPAGCPRGPLRSAARGAGRRPARLPGRPAGAAFTPYHGGSRGTAFTLIEILIVVAIFSLLAMVGLQQLTRMRITTNEQLALVSLRLIAKSCHWFNTVNQRYPLTLAELGSPGSSPPYIEDAMLLSGAKQGYVFAYTPEAGPTPAAFALNVNPQVHGQTGERHVLVDETLTVYFTKLDLNATTSDLTVP